jgi:hypothetical protein
MSDITELFNSVGPSADEAPSEATVEADVARGRTALTRDHRRRTIRRSMLASTSVAAAAVVIVVASQLGGGAGAVHHPNTATKLPTTHAPATFPKVQNKHTAKVRTAPIKLVAYNGKQLVGFTVDRVPDGWFLSTSTQFALLIDPQGDKDNDPNAFVGKLAVLTQSRDVHSLPKGTPVTVNGQPGVISDQGKYGLSLTYNSPSGFGVVIQAPAVLNWTDDQLVSFAEGVHVTSNAVQSRG